MMQARRSSRTRGRVTELSHFLAGNRFYVDTPIPRPAYYHNMNILIRSTL